MYQDGGGTNTYEPAAGASAAAAPSSAVISNIVNNTSEAADVPVTSGYCPFSVGGRHRDLESASSTATVWDKSATAKLLRFSSSTAPHSGFFKYGRTLCGGAAGSSGGGGVRGFEATSHGACDGVMDVVGHFAAHGAAGGGGGGSGVGGGCHPLRAGSGYAAVGGAGYLDPRSFARPNPSPTPARARHRFMESPVTRHRSKRQPGSDYTLDEPAWNGRMNKTAAFSGMMVPPPAPSSRPAMQKKSTVSGTLPLEMRGHDTMLHHAPLGVSNRFLNESSEVGGGRSTTMHLPPPPPAAPGGGYLSPSARCRKKLRVPLTTITGMAARRAPSGHGPIATVEASRADFDYFFNRRSDQLFGASAEGATGLFGKAPSMAASIAAAATGGSTESQSQLVKSFPASISLAEKTSLRLAFGSALTQEAWFLGTSTLLDAELNLD